MAEIAMTAGTHVATVRLLPDIRGLVAFATCSCGWRSANHPSGPIVDHAKQLATDEMTAHLMTVGDDPRSPA